MAEVNAGDGNDGKKGQPKKIHVRVDFTPMVDMNMLLITFFMFCTTLSKPQMMNLVMPTKENNVNIENRTKADEARTITLLLSGDDVVYYYFGKPKYDDYTSLIKSSYNSEGGIRSMLVERNGGVIKTMAELRSKRQLNEISEESFRDQAKTIRDAKGGLTIVIKPTEASTYKNLVDVLDEMQICSIGMYAIVDITEGDTFLIDNYLQQGALTAQAEKVKKLSAGSSRKK
jgi:biopolymer transport protein ExbD